MLTELQLEEFRKCIERELGKIYEVIARPGAVSYTHLTLPTSDLV